MNQQLLIDVFQDIILGRGVKRIVHDLQLDGHDHSHLFIEQLNACGYKLIPLKSIDPGIGYRIPGFYLMDGKAYFGYLFWEVFSPTRKRKIWGSVKRNKRGDWAVILPGNSTKMIYLNPSIRQEVDIYHLT